ALEDRALGDGTAIRDRLEVDALRVGARVHPRDVEQLRVAQAQLAALERDVHVLAACLRLFFLAVLDELDGLPRAFDLLLLLLLRRVGEFLPLLPRHGGCSERERDDRGEHECSSDGGTRRRCRRFTPSDAARLRPFHASGTVNPMTRTTLALFTLIMPAPAVS